MMSRAFGNIIEGIRRRLTWHRERETREKALALLPEESDDDYDSNDVLHPFE